jgi:pimeloyl-ACP methyl ester carboxylesterase
MHDDVREFHYRSADGLALYCRLFEPTAANDTTVLCLHGLTRNSLDFVELATHLRKHWRVLAPDLRGRGNSAYDPHWENYHPGTYCDDVELLLRDQQVRRAIIIGTSLGALLAMLLAARNPELVAGIVLNDAGPEIDPAGLARIQRYVGRQAPPASWAEAIAQVRANYEAALPGLDAAQWERYTRRTFHEDDSGRPVPASDPAIGNLFRSGEATPQTLWPLFERLRSVPVLAIRGAMSDILSAATLERMAHIHPGLQQVTVANRGHAPLLDEPECIAAIDAFLHGLARQRGE